MAKLGPAQDTSMEDILASIRRIIADDDDRKPMGPRLAVVEPPPEMKVEVRDEAVAPAPAAPEKTIAPPAETLVTRAAVSEAPVVAEPTISIESTVAVVASSDRVTMPAPERTAPEATTPAVAEEPASTARPAPVLMPIPPAPSLTAALSAIAAPEPKPEATAEPPASSARTNSFDRLTEPVDFIDTPPPPPRAKPFAQRLAEGRAAAAETPPPPPQPSLGAVRGPELLSPESDIAVNAAFNQLASIMLTNQARTLEDLVKDMMRPMLRDWLDDNLPPLVERLVREEIERVSRGRR